MKRRFNIKKGNCYRYDGLTVLCLTSYEGSFTGIVVDRVFHLEPIGKILYNLASSAPWVCVRNVYYTPREVERLCAEHPIMYSEEEVKVLCKKALNSNIGGCHDGFDRQSQFENWWDKTKK